MNIDILGPVTATVRGNRRGIQANKVRAVLATLALEAGRTVSHQALVDELWSGLSLRNTRNALQAHVTRLRRILDEPTSQPGRPGVLCAVPNGYRLDIPPEHVDANRFLELAIQGTAALTDRPERAQELLQASLRLWRGPALLDAGDGLRCRGAAELFDERRLAVREDLVSARLALGEESHAVAELRQLLAQYPQRERLCELLMLALYRTGRQSEALELFHVTRRRLDEDLGIQPGIRLQRRHAEILAQEPSLVLPSAAWSGCHEIATASL